MYNTIIQECEESIAILRFDRPNVLNALNRQVFLEMISIFEEIQKEVFPKVVILTGSGDRAFISGTDITEMENLSSFEAREFAILAGKAIDRVENVDRPVIAAINGFALGGGCELAMACDISTTTLNSFKKNHKAYITGLELGLQTALNFAEIQKHLKILGFHF